MKTKVPCRTLDPELWFPISKIGPGARQAEQAKELCRTRCPILLECLELALSATEVEGIWGGTDEDERRLIRASRKQADRTVA